MGETYYDVLEVDPDATREEIRAAYRERVLETHPDHNDAPDAAEQFKRVSTAKSVLTDGTERARYDRLGHESYVRLAEHSAGEGSAGDSDSSTNDSSASATESNASTGGGSNTSTTRDSSASATDSSADANGSTKAASGARASTRRETRTGSAGPRTGSGRRHSSDRDATGTSRSGSQRDARAESHHARQRKRRRQQRTRQRATSGWSFGSETTATAGTSNHRGSTATATGSEREAEASAFRYAVHDWTGDVDLEWEGQPLEYSTAVTIGCCWLLYPVFIAAALTPAFSIAVNAIVAACTLGLVGYMLTRPRVAAALFGSWSVLFPIGIDWLIPVSQFSLVGLVALGFAWIPFGYALVLWWALRP